MEIPFSGVRGSDVSYPSVKRDASVNVVALVAAEVGLISLERRYDRFSPFSFLTVPELTDWNVNLQTLTLAQRPCPHVAAVQM
jgi:hypothetical protein